MSENTPLTNLLIDAVEGYLASEDGGGMLTGFVGIVEYVDTDGDVVHRFVSPTEQPASRSVGMTEYAGELFRMLMRSQIAEAGMVPDFEEDE